MTLMDLKTKVADLQSLVKSHSVQISNLVSQQQTNVNDITEIRSLMERMEKHLTHINSELNPVGFSSEGNSPSVSVSSRIDIIEFLCIDDSEKDGGSVVDESLVVRTVDVNHMDHSLNDHIAGDNRSVKIMFVRSKEASSQNQIGISAMTVNSSAKEDFLDKVEVPISWDLCRVNNNSEKLLPSSKIASPIVEYSVAVGDNATLQKDSATVVCSMSELSLTCAPLNGVVISGGSRGSANANRHSGFSWDPGTLLLRSQRRSCMIQQNGGYMHSDSARPVTHTGVLSQDFHTPRVVSTRLILKMFGVSQELYKLLSDEYCSANHPEQRITTRGNPVYNMYGILNGETFFLALVEYNGLVTAVSYIRYSPWANKKDYTAGTQPEKCQQWNTVSFLECRSLTMDLLIPNAWELEPPLGTSILQQFKAVCVVTVTTKLEPGEEVYEHRVVNVWTALTRDVADCINSSTQSNTLLSSCIPQINLAQSVSSWLLSEGMNAYFLSSFRYKLNSDNNLNCGMVHDPVMHWVAASDSTTKVTIFWFGWNFSVIVPIISICSSLSMVLTCGETEEWNVLLLQIYEKEESAGTATVRELKMSTCFVWCLYCCDPCITRSLQCVSQNGGISSYFGVDILLDTSLSYTNISIFPGVVSQYAYKRQAVVSLRIFKNPSTFHKCSVWILLQIHINSHWQRQPHASQVFHSSAAVEIQSAKLASFKRSACTNRGATNSVFTRKCMGSRYFNPIHNHKLFGLYITTESFSPRRHRPVIFLKERIVVKADGLLRGSADVVCFYGYAVRTELSGVVLEPGGQSEILVVVYSRDKDIGMKNTGRYSHLETQAAVAFTFEPGPITSEFSRAYTTEYSEGTPPQTYQSALSQFSAILVLQDGNFSRYVKLGIRLVVSLASGFYFTSPSTVFTCGCRWSGFVTSIRRFIFGYDPCPLTNLSTPALKRQLDEMFLLWECPLLQHDKQVCWSFHDQKEFYKYLDSFEVGSSVAASKVYVFFNRITTYSIAMSHLPSDAPVMGYTVPIFKVSHVAQGGVGCSYFLAWLSVVCCYIVQWDGYIKVSNQTEWEKYLLVAAHLLNCLCHIAWIQVLVHGILEPSLILEDKDHF